jgi:pyrroloquinoline quinone (PQQ) biosynthesis protein C
MTLFDRLLAETEAERNRFLGLPIIRRARDEGVPAELYLAFLGQAYHHVRQTCPLLGLALSRCGEKDRAYREGLIGYIDEEMGHEDWILDDIAALGGNADAVRRGRPGIPCRAMVAYATWAIEHVSPYALLGMVHVLEGMSVELAEGVARRISAVLGNPGGKMPAEGFRYLTSHGALDRDHVRYFEALVNGIEDAEAADAIVDTANAIYRLYGDMFVELADGADLSGTHADAA